MEVFICAQDYEVWKVVSQGPFQLPDDESTWNREQIRQSVINYSTMNIMQCAIHLNEFSKISTYKSAKEMWDKLELIYEGTFEVKETKANLLITEYEMFKIKSDESIFEMFARLMQLINNLKALDKEYSNSDLVRKVLRSLTPMWHTKVTVIEDSKKLLIISLDELIGSLMKYELNLKRNEDDRKKKQSLLRGRKNLKP